jgi:hypothetical protein
VNKTIKKDKYSEEVTIIDVWGTSGEGDIKFKFREFELNCFLPDWLVEGWYEEVYPEGWDSYFIGKNNKDNNPKIELNEKKQKLLIFLFQVRNKAISPLEKEIRHLKEKDKRYYLIRGEIIEMDKKHMVIDCGCFVFMDELRSRGYKIGDYIEAWGRLDAYKAEKFLKRRSRD